QKTFKGKYTPDDADDMLLELKRTVSRMQKILADAEACEFVLVGQPARMVVNETQRLYDKLAAHEVAVNTLVINCVAPDSEDDFYHKRFNQQQMLLQDIASRFSKIDIVQMPLFSQEVIGTENVELFENQLFDET
ncbi:MAG: ArsA-related P-loop ATPase, partial [Bacteroidota bacterium]